jgi:hypothetical protein
LTLSLVVVVGCLGALFAPAGHLARVNAQETAGGALCTKTRAQLYPCADGNCPAQYQYPSNTLLLPSGAGGGDFLGVADPITGEQLYLRASQAAPCAAAAWQTRPVIPAATGRAREVYARGLSMGNNPRVFIRVGDCLSVPYYFLGNFDKAGSYDLGPYADLQSVIDHFSGSFERINVTSDNGFNVASVLSPIWSDPRQCNPDENPLQCEYRLVKPSFAIVSMGTNWNSRPADVYEGYMREIIAFLMENGVVPILSTKADNIEGGHQMNAVVARLADEYNLPLWNFWLAAQPLPNHGLVPDRFHLSFARDFFGDDRRLRTAGWPVRNLTALQTLNAVWRGVQ